MSIQYLAPGFELMTVWLRESSFNHSKLAYITVIYERKCFKGLAKGLPPSSKIVFDLFQVLRAEGDRVQLHFDHGRGERDCPAKLGSLPWKVSCHISLLPKHLQWVNKQTF